MALFLIRARRRRDGQGAPAGRGRTTGTRRGRAPGPASFSLLTPAANGTHHERPEPRLRWSDDHAVPAGDFQASAIANAALGPDDIPVRGDSSDALAEFALSYDGYAYWDDLPELANRVLQRWTRDRSLPATLDELRGCLFYEQRRWHHFGEDPAGRSARYMWAVVEAIDELVAPGPAAAGAPRDPRPARASEAHVQVLPRPGVVAPGRVDAGVARAVPGPSRPVAPRGGLRPVRTHPVGLRVVAPRRGTLRPVPAARGRVPAGGVSAAPPDAGAHVRLVSAIESGPTAATFVSGRPDDGGRLDTVPGRRAAASHDGAPSDGGRLAAGVDQPVARHPSAWRRGRPSSAARHDLLPMPSAEPLPKPSVIERRPHQALEAPPGNGVVRALAGRAGASPPRAAVAVFHHDDAGYRHWLDVHPGGFVLNHARGGRAPTLHRAGCGALEGSRNRAQPVTGRSPKACAPTAEALAAWNAAHGTGAPAPCGRCRP